MVNITAKKILIIDDSVSIRQSMKSILEEGGYQVVCAIDGKDGLNKLESDPVDCVITDINMPNINGLELLKTIRVTESMKYLPVLVLTSESETDMIKQGISLGATGWLIKPFNAEKLISSVKKIIPTQS